MSFNSQNTVYDLLHVLFSRELLSPQQHYDWGLRALKTVLRGCGSLLDQEKSHHGGKKGTTFVYARTCQLDSGLSLR